MGSMTLTPLVESPVDFRGSLRVGFTPLEDDDANAEYGVLGEYVDRAPTEVSVPPVEWTKLDASVLEDIPAPVDALAPVDAPVQVDMSASVEAIKPMKTPPKKFNTLFDAGVDSEDGSQALPMEDPLIILKSPEPTLKPLRLVRIFCLRLIGLQLTNDIS